MSVRSITTGPWGAEPKTEEIFDHLGSGLAVSWDCDRNPQNRKSWKTVLLYWWKTMQGDDHVHIEITRKQAVKLRDWLNRFLEETK